MLRVWLKWNLKNSKNIPYHPMLTHEMFELKSKLIIGDKQASLKF